MTTSSMEDNLTAPPAQLSKNALYKYPDTCYDSDIEH
jgi:hypothetical protein